MRVTRNRRFCFEHVAVTSVGKLLMVTSVAVCFVHFALIGLILKYVSKFGFQSFMRLIYTFLSRIYMPLYLHRRLQLRMRCVLRPGVSGELLSW